MSDDDTIQTATPHENGELSEPAEERWRELHETPLGELSDAEITSKIKLSVKRRFDHPEWVLMFEYGAPGNTGSVCDCLAVNTLPSRNYKVVGFEFKASRSDWLREVRDGQKADYFVQLADEFYVVAPKGVVEDSEIPDGWGYLEMKPNSEQLYKLQDSELTDHQHGDPGRRFWIRFLKQTLGDETNYTQEDLKEARSRGYADGKADAMETRNLDRDLDRLRSKADSYDRLQDQFAFLRWSEFDQNDAETLNLAVQLIRAVNGDSYSTIQGQIEHLRDNIERRTDRMLEDIDQLHGGFEKLQDRTTGDNLPGIPIADGETHGGDER
jgi:hypothetical protein